MTAISLIEFFVYGFVGYGGVLMMIISVIRDVPTKRKLTSIRVIFLIPSMIACAFLSGSGPDIVFTTEDHTITNLNTTEVWTDTSVNKITLVNEAWILFHYMLFLMLMIYIFVQLLLMLTQTD